MAELFPFPQINPRCLDCSTVQFCLGQITERQAAIGEVQEEGWQALVGAQEASSSMEAQGHAGVVAATERQIGSKIEALGTQIKPVENMTAQCPGSVRTLGSLGRRGCGLSKVEQAAMRQPFNDYNS